MDSTDKVYTNTPLVSVIIPSYNHDRHVKKSVESVLNQTYSDIELIVIDDGSQDESITIIKSLLEDYEFTFIHRENCGLAATLNEGIKKSEGKYICFLASDDYYLPTRIENSVAALEKTNINVAAVYCDGYIIDDKDRKFRIFGEKYQRPLTGSNYLNLIAGNWIPALGVTYKAEIIKRYLFDEKFLVEDYTLYLQMFRNDIHRILYYHDYGFCYRWHGSNFSKDKSAIAEQNSLIGKSFGDVKSFSRFKKLISKRKFPNRSDMSLNNIKVLIYSLIRKSQGNSKRIHSSISDLFIYYLIRVLNLFLERLKGVRYFGMLGLKQKARVRGKVEISGRRKNLMFGKNLRVLGDVKFVLEESFNGRPSVIIGNGVSIEHGAYIYPQRGSIEIGSKSHIGVMCIVQGRGGVNIGAETFLGPSVKIFSSNHYYGEMSQFRESNEYFKGVLIGNNVWLGADTVVLDGAIVEDNCVFGAGGIVNKLYQEGSICVSKPLRATPIRTNEPNSFNVMGPK